MYHANVAFGKARQSAAAAGLVPPRRAFTSSQQRARARVEHVSKYQLSPAPSVEVFRAQFAQILIRAGRCSECSCCRRLTQSSQYSTALRSNDPDDQVKKTGNGPKATPYTKEDYLQLLGSYDLPNQDGRNAGRESSAVSSGEGDGDAGKGAEEPQHDLIALREAIKKLDRLLVSAGGTPEEIFEAYQQLPEPGIKYLRDAPRRWLINKLSVMEHKHPTRTMSFLSILDDHRKAGLPIPLPAWNSALALGSTTLSQITDDEVEFALRTWKEMELQAGVRGNEVTFNILFDVASKAGKFTLADMILREMEARKLELTRFTRVSMLLHHGLRGNGDDVRRAYYDLVHAKEVVDTVVLNCVISALMTAGEPDAAHAVFERMKSLAEEREGSGYAPRKWAKRRELGRILQDMARQARASEKGGEDHRPADMRRLFSGMQDMVSIAPDVRTCNILLRHYCSAGDMERVSEVLDIMQQTGIKHDERTFTHIFRGFATHGSQQYTSWTADRLRLAWKACKEFLDSGQLILGDRSKLMGIWALVAVRRCDTNGKARHVYHILQSAWQGHNEFAEEFLDPASDEQRLLPLPSGYKDTDLADEEPVTRISKDVLWDDEPLHDVRHTCRP